MLFYIRKDAIDKKIEDLVPSINEYFPGKPVQINQGDGFILGAKP